MIVHLLFYFKGFSDCSVLVCSSSDQIGALLQLETDKLYWIFKCKSADIECRLLFPIFCLFSLFYCLWYYLSILYSQMFCLSLYFSLSLSVSFPSLWWRSTSAFPEASNTGGVIDIPPSIALSLALHRVWEYQLVCLALNSRTVDFVTCWWYTLQKRL